jgi:uncharacterized protein
MLLFYLAAAPWVIRMGYPPLFAGLLTIPLILVPWMLGYLAREAKQRTGGYRVLSAVSYREALPWGKYLVLGVPVVLWGALIFAITGAVVEPALVGGIFSWLPDWFLNPADFEQIVAMPIVPLWIFLGSLLVFAGIVAPVVEELYFRGNLLPAVDRYGVWAPVFTVALFTLYHFESPWENPGRFLVVLPMAWVVWYKRSVWFGLAVHVALNTISALGLTYAVFAARRG